MCCFSEKTAVTKLFNTGSRPAELTKYDQN